MKSSPPRFSDYLAAEWRPALGCTEPASIAYAAALAATQIEGELLGVQLVCDPRIYKNCYAVGIPYSGHKVGILWALAIGSLLPDPSAKLECFRQIDAAILGRAARLIDDGLLRVEVDASCPSLLVDCRVQRTGGTARAVIEGDHTRVVRLERDGAVLQQVADHEQQEPQPGIRARPRACRTPRSRVAPSLRARSGGAPLGCGAERARWDRELLSGLSFEQLIEMARSLTDSDREQLRDGVTLNLAIARHGLTLFPDRFVQMAEREPLTRISRLVCAGVYARMWGEDFRVMSLAGSGNKGIVCSVPMALWGQELAVDPQMIDEALALACVVTSTTTHHLGTLSAVCGCSNAAGIGLAAGLVTLEGGGPHEISLAINNMVGNVTGMVCDGAKIGCALKTMTSVDAAFRAASLALSGIGIPVTDGIVGRTGVESLRNLGRLATRGMVSVDQEILQIMQEKLT